MSIQGNVNQILGSMGMVGSLAKQAYNQSPKVQAQIREEARLEQEKAAGEKARLQYQEDISELKGMYERLGANTSSGEELKPLEKIAKKRMQKRYDELMNRIYDVEKGKGIEGSMYEKYIKDIGIDEKELEELGTNVAVGFKNVKTTDEVFEENLKKRGMDAKANLQNSINKSFENLDSNASAKIQQQERMSEIRRKILEGTPSEYLLGGNNG